MTGSSMMKMSAGRCTVTLSVFFLGITEHASAQVLPPSPSQEEEYLSQQSSRGISLSPDGIAALVGIIVMLCTTILCFAGWRIWVWRRRIANKKRAAWRGLSQPFDSDVMDIALPASPVTAWTRDSFPDSLTVDSTICSTLAKVTTVRSLTPPRFSASLPSLGITPPPGYAEYPVSALSARIASKTPTAMCSVLPMETPHLVIVESAFKATSRDELKVCEGEILRLVHEYEDGWCHVQRVGAQVAEQGVVPRVCIVDTPEVVLSKE